MKDYCRKKIEEEIKKNRSSYARVNSYFDIDEEADDRFLTMLGHFHIKFDNGYEISLFNGSGSYTENLYKIIDDDEVYSKTIEVAIIKDGYFCTRDFYNVDDDVIPLVSADDLVNIMLAVRDYKGEKNE